MDKKQVKVKPFIPYYTVCTECGSRMTYRTDLEYTFKDITVKPIKAYVCDNCGEKEIELEEARRIEKIVKETMDVRDNKD